MKFTPHESGTMTSFFHTRTPRYRSEWNHYPDSDRAFLREVNARSINSSLVSYQGKSGGVLLYPFDELKPPFSGVPAPKVRAGDVVEVTTSRKTKLSEFVIPRNAAVR